MRTEIPASVLAVVAEVAPLTGKLMPPWTASFSLLGRREIRRQGSKHTEVLPWLRRVSNDPSVEPLTVLGHLIEGYTDAVSDPHDFWARKKQEAKERIEQVLAQCELQCVKGGRVIATPAASSRE